MSPLPEGHWREVAAARRLGPRDRWIIGSVLALVLAGVVALVISLGTSGGKSGGGCIDVTVQGPVGGTQLRRCGEEARALCKSVSAAGGGANEAVSKAIARECRKAGLPAAS